MARVRNSSFHLTALTDVENSLAQSARERSRSNSLSTLRDLQESTHNARILAVALEHMLFRPVREKPSVANAHYRFRDSPEA